MINQQQRVRHNFSVNFQAQMIKLDEQGKSRSKLVRQYDLTPSALDRCINQSSKSGSVKTKDNRTPEQNKLIA
jgi:transposase